MMRSLFSGVSGLKVHQTKMDVIGNNIANVNTVGFKSSSVNFSDVFYQTTQSASGPNAATGSAGRNAMQIGLGANVASITQSITTQGASQRTDNPFDVMIQGDGFFIVNSGGTNYFTKAGAFGVDAFGTLCTPTGATVMGWQVNDDGEIVRDTVSALQIMSPKNLYSEPEATKAAYVSGNIDSIDTQLTSDVGKIVNISFYDKTGHSYTADIKISRDESDPEGRYSVSITDIIDENNQSIFVKKTKDTDGKDIYVASDITEFTFGGYEFRVATDGIDVETGEVTLESTGVPILTFDSANGKFLRIVGTGDDGGTDDDNVNNISLNINPTLSEEENLFSNIEIDFSSITHFATNGTSNLTAVKGNLEGKDGGKRFGNMTGVSIDTAGKIYGKYDNGDSVLLGQLAVATFSNPAGLEAVGNNMFAATQNSGEFDGIGQDPTQGGGSLTTGVLEMSNVDLAAQFTEMITTQRGFQANSRIITTSDSMLEELINLKR
ncbi:MAG: flagellar hook protein FlgE [Clostridiales bacterium]|nr:flagellar hook protein FlgE [Clostridiales bacterium]